MKKFLFAFLVVVVLLTPSLSFAAGVGLAGPIVPQTALYPNTTTGTGGSDFTLCDLRVLANNIIDFAVALSVIVATLMFAYGGILYVTASAGGEAQIKKAHAVLLNAIVGIFIVLLAWLVINIVLSVLTGNGVQFWIAFNCEKNPVSAEFPAALPAGPLVTGSGATPPTAPGGSTATCTQGTPFATQKYQNQLVPDSEMVTVVDRTKQYLPIMQNCANQYNIPVQDLQGLMVAENHNNVPNPMAIDPAPNGGWGLMQVTVQAARDYSPSRTNGLTDQQVQHLMQTDNTFDICASAHEYSNALNSPFAHGDPGLASVMYNGGEGALLPSVSCPGLLKFQSPIFDGSKFNYQTSFPWYVVGRAYCVNTNTVIALTGGTPGGNCNGQ